jgi:two-component system OmpR family sensor kinase
LSASKNRATSLQQSEKKTLISFLALYIFFAIIILLFSAVLYYNTQKDLMLSEQNSKLKSYSDEMISKLRFLHENFRPGIRYPRSDRYKSAIYDASYKEIFSTLDERSVDFNKNIYVIGDKIHYIRILERYYLGTIFLVIEIDDSSNWINFIKMKVLMYGVVLFLILVIGGYFLLKLMLKPMRDSIYLLDRFIKDTTHELNTPVSTILMNIEAISKDALDEKVIKKIDRIDIASRTISNIYNDLTYVVLKNQLVSKDEDIDLKELIIERCQFFKLIYEQKRIECRLELKEGVFLHIDRVKMSRVVDNLISNAIKYNKKGGYIKIVLDDKHMSIQDSGIGMSKEEIKEIFNRYTRFSSSEGGFGIGLNIVHTIAKEYKIKIDIRSQKGEGTEVKLKW